MLCYFNWNCPLDLYQPGGADTKLFTYGYDDAGRLDYVNQYVGFTPEDPESEGDNSGSYFTLAKYKYNPNSQVDSLLMNNRGSNWKYIYNSRNWNTNFYKTGTNQFSYSLTYNANGNIRQSQYQGNYANYFGVAGSYQYTYIYDNANRLLKAENDSGNSSTSFDIINGYDKDGNIMGMKRYGSSNNLADNFSYQYFSGTNRLKKVSAGLADDYAYDNNGNMTSDQLNRTGSIKYDHRNLMTEIRAIKTEAGGGIGGGTVDVTYLTQYRYDEAGNRVRKTRWKYTGSTPDPVFDLSGDTPPWSQQSDEFYVRDVSGKEIAIYSGSSLSQWNIWGLDNVGKINADTTRNYYLKDHLGSVRVVLNSTNGIVSAQDYDAWGYPLENRSYQSTNTLYKFTSKERDNETSYDYFGARYYDSRIGRWGGVEMLLDKYLDVTPYCYSVNNPIKYIDVDGNDLGDGQRERLSIMFNPIKQIKLAINDIGERYNSAVENFSQGNIAMGLLETATLPTLTLGLIPSSPLLDFAIPIGSVEQSTKLLKVSENLTLKEQATEISSFIGKNRVTMPEGTLDLIGKSHGNIETPHFKPLIFQTNEGKFFPKTISKLTRNATQEDLNKAVTFINNLIVSKIMKTGL